MTGVPLPMPWMLGVGWGAIAAGPFLRRGRRVVGASRVSVLAGNGRPPEAAASPGWSRLRARLASRLAAVRGGPVGRVWDATAGRRRAAAADAELSRELPVVIDLLGVAVGSGCTPYLAVQVAARWSPSAAARRLDGVLRSCAMGMSFDAALADAARQAPPMRGLSDALLASERLGAPVGPVLARLAAEERTALRRRAEAHARRVPVRLLFPLVFLVLPAFVLLTVVPGLAAGLNRL